MTLTLAQFKERTSAIVGLTDAASSTELSLMTSWTNEAVLLWLMETKMFRQKFTMSVTAGSSDYDLPQELLAFTDAYYVPADGSQSYMLEPVDSADIRQFRLYQTAAPQSPKFYSLDGTNLFSIYPTPVSSSDLIHIIGVGVPDEMSADSSTPSESAFGGVPPEWHPALLSYVLWKAADYSDNPKAPQFMQEWDAWKVKAKVKMNTKGGTKLPTARWGRRRAYPLTPGTDTGV